jgi:hypothetical protein
MTAGDLDQLSYKIAFIPSSTASGKSPPPVAFKLFKNYRIYKLFVKSFFSIIFDASSDFSFYISLSNLLI